MTLYIVEDYNTCEFECFKTLEQANHYVREYYRAHMMEWYKNMPIDECLSGISADLDGLNAAMAYIDDALYIHEATLHE